MFLVLVMFTNTLGLPEKFENLTVTNTDASEAKPIQPSGNPSAEEVKNYYNSANKLSPAVILLSDEGGKKYEEKLKLLLKGKIL